MFEPENKKKWVITITLLGMLVVVVAIVVFPLLYRKKLPAAVETNVVPSPVLDNIVPKDAKSPEEFLNEVREKSAAIQKDYDSNLTEFARKRWEKIFWEQNGGKFSESENNLKILNQELQKTNDQSTLYKIKYRVKQGGAELEMEDYYYLILSEKKRVELGLNNLKSNIFLSEEDIKNNLAQDNFAKIGKIEK